MKNSTQKSRNAKSRISLFVWTIFAASLGNLYFLITRINSSESNLFPAGTKIHFGWPWRNGDHMYYVSSALQHAGVPYSQSLQNTAEYFSDWPAGYQDLDNGYINLGSAPLIFPRYLLSRLLGFGYQISGFTGINLVVLVIGAMSTLLISFWAFRKFDYIAALLALSFSISSFLFLKYGFGLFTESVIILITALWLFILPWGNEKGKVRGLRLVAFAASLYLLLLTRQVPLIPVAVLGAGWLHALVRSRRFTNSWTPFVLVGAVVDVTGYFFLTKWAPLGAFSFSTTSQTVASISGTATREGYNLYQWINFVVERTWENIVTLDPFMAILVILTFAGLFICRESEIHIVGLAVLIVSAPYMLIAYPEYRFLAPAITFLIAASVVTSCKLLCLVFNRDNDIFSHTSYDEKSSAKFVRATSIGVISMSLIISLFLVRDFTPDNKNLVLQMPLNKMSSGHSQLSGYVECYSSDAQTWFIAPDGTRYVASGTALARNFGAESVAALPQEIAKYLDYDSLYPSFISKCLSMQGR